jgi:hypothetical protein
VARTFTDLQTEALGNDFSASTFPGSRVGQYLNEAVTRVARRAHIPSLETTQSISTVNGTNTYALAADDVRILSVSNTTDRDPLEEVDIDEIDDYATSTGKPALFALSANSLVFFPTPDAVYPLQVRYLKSTTFVNGSDTTTAVGYPDAYADLLVLFARGRMLRAEDDFDGASQFMAQFENDLRALKSDLQRQSPRRVRRVGDGRLGPAPLPFQIP